MSMLETFRNQRRALHDEAMTMLDKAQAENRDLNPTEIRRYDEITADMEGLKAAIEKREDQAATDRDVTDSLRKLGIQSTAGNDSARTEGAAGYLNLANLATSARAYAKEHGGYEVRALLASGSTIGTADVLTQSPVTLGKPATALLDVIPSRTVEGGAYSYLRQTARTNNAAPVAVGGTKPTSVMTLERQTGELEVVAHMSEPVHEPWLEDVAALDQFVRGEMATGIASALEDQLLNGTGVSPELAGIVATATGTQAYATSPLVTIRTGLAQFEAAGLKASGVVLAASDWLAIETATVTGGAFLLGQGTNGAPLDSVRRTLWGVPVVVSSAHTAGTAVLLSQESVGLAVDGSVRFVWGRIDTDFSQNQVRARAEMRAQVEVYRPAGVIIADLTA